MASSTPTSNLTALLQGAPTAGNARLERCPPQTLTRLQNLNEAEVITLFTPVVPHPPESALDKQMDPFEPLGRSFTRKLRHVPYRLDHGMTPTHADFLPASGALVIVLCATQHVLEHSALAFQHQLFFARDIAAKLLENAALADVPLVLVLVSDGPARLAHLEAVRDFPVLVTLDDYLPAALANAVAAMPL